MSLIEQILSWVNEQHKWQQKAVSLLLAKAQLSEEDIEELVEICKVEHGVVEGGELPILLPLTIETIAGATAG